MANPNTPTTAAANAKAAPTAAPATPLPLPANTFTAPMGRSTVTVVCMPGVLYGLAVQHNGSTVVLPFALPCGVAAGPQPCVLASTNANWLGRNGAPLCAHVYAAPGRAGMGVVLQPNGVQGYKANAYTAGLHVGTLPVAGA